MAEACRRRCVVRLEAFGFAARDDFDEARSAFDVLVLLGNSPTSSAFDADFDLKDALEQVFGRPVNLVSDGAVQNPCIQPAIDRDRQLVYAA